MKTLLLPLTSMIALCFVTPNVSADELPSGGKPDKSGYSLFHPVPSNLMREMTTDRPSKTESPYTVDAGHFQFETDLVTYTADTNKNEERQTSTFNNINLKVGLLDNLDLQSIVESYVQASKTKNGKTERTDGFGDVTLRMKWNALGNEGGPVGLGLIPIVKLPTSNGTGVKKLEGGILTVATFALPADTALGVELGYTRASNENDDGHHNEVVTSASVSHDLFGQLGGYVEFFNQSSDEAGREWVATCDTGLTYKVSKDIQADAGVNLGLTETADDINPFLGLTMRY